MASVRGITRTARTASGPSSIIRSATASQRPAASPAAPLRWAVRCASNRAAPAVPLTDAVFQDLETDSSMLSAPLPSDVKIPSPLERARSRKTRLPGSRYQYHPPKYDRGPLHPIQSPASSEPIARDFVPGPFHLARLRQTYTSTIASDLMTMGYVHVPPGTPKEPTPDRLRGWDGTSPYHQNRPKRGPKGGGSLRLLEKPISFRNIPEIRSVTIATYVPLASKEPERLVVAQSVIQAISGTSPEVTRVKRSVSQWSVIKGNKAGAKVTIYGNAAYDFLDRCIHIVFPQIKDWPGVKGTTGDSSGNLAWGFRPEDVALFPEVEANISMYPTKMLPGFRVFVETTATSDRHARLLLKSFGVPFYGDLRD